MVNRLLRSLPWCFFNPSAIVCLSLIHGGAWRKKHCVAWGHQWLQRRLRSRRAAAVQWNDINKYRHYGRRLHHHHSRCAGRVCRARVSQTLSMRGERWFAAQVGASWRAGAAILFPIILDGYEAAFVAAAARAQSELWLPPGVARIPSACAEQCCVRARASVCMPHDACESRLRELVRHGRILRSCVRIMLSSFGRHPLEEAVRHCVWY